MPERNDPRPAAPTAAAAAAASLRLERRSQDRLLSRRLVVAHYQQGAEPVQELARIWNLSTGGIGLWLAYPIAAGTTVQLGFRHRAVADRRAQVLDASGEGETWVVNCQLERPLSPGELRALLT